jgi:MFS family permease
MSTDTRRGRAFVIALLALFTAGAAVSLRAVTAAHMRADYLDALDPARAGERIATVLGAAFAGFAITLLLVSAVLARIGFARALTVAGALLAIGLVMVGSAGMLGISPYAALLAGMLVQGLGWGMVETAINPLTSALYPEDRVGRLGILHAWYPAGVVAGSLLGLVADGAGLPWRWTLAPVVLLSLLFGALALREPMPDVSRATDAPVSLGAMTRATLRNPTVFLWVVTMMFTASTELAPGQWVDVALSQIVGMRGILLLVYVSGLMFVMRHFAGPLVHRFGNVGLLTFSAVLSAIGLYALSLAHSPATALAAATLWGFGVCYFWPTMLATVAERYPGSGTMVFGLMGSAGAASVYVVLPTLGAVYDRARLAAAGGDAHLAATAQGAQLTQILTAAASASFRAAALIPAALVVIFIAILLADRMRRRRSS